MARDGSSLHLPPIEVFSARLADLGLTYVPSDVGPEVALRPRPVALDPGRGAWMIDPGPRRDAPALVAISADGRAGPRVPLRDPLRLRVPRLFVPCHVGFGQRRAHVLGSRLFDFEARAQLDYVLALFDPSGAIAALTPVPDLAYAGRALADDEGWLVNLEREGGRAEWIVYGPDGRCVERLPSGSQEEAPIAFAGTARARLVDRMSATQALVVGARGAPRLVPWRAPPIAARPVNGAGALFGFVHQSPPIASAAEQDVFEQRRRLDVLRFDEALGAVIHVGQSTLSPSRIAAGRDDFLVFSDGQSVLDRGGDLYEIAWTSAEIRCLRYPVDRARL